MYAYLTGEITEKHEEGVVLENNGIGYALLLPLAQLAEVRVGEFVKLHTHFAVREDGVQLFGFLTRDDLSFFRMLLSVSGIGPKGALGILGYLSADDLRFVILSGDAAALSKAPGIGKKTAQKIILELKDKLDLEDAFEKKMSHTAAAAKADTADDPQAEATLALEALGYPGAQALRAVRKVMEEMPEADVETILKAALKEM